MFPPTTLRITLLSALPCTLLYMTKVTRYLQNRWWCASIHLISIRGTNAIPVKLIRNFKTQWWYSCLFNAVHLSVISRWQYYTRCHTADRLVKTKACSAPFLHVPCNVHIFHDGFASHWVMTLPFLLSRNFVGLWFQPKYRMSNENWVIWVIKPFT